MIRQRQPFEKQLARHVHRFLHGRAEAIVEAPRKQILHRIAVALEHIQRQIDAILFQIHDHILPEIGELQRRASGVGKRLPLRVAIAAQPQHQAAHRIRRIAAVVEQLLEVAIARDGLILLEGLDQIVERLDRQVVLRDGRPQRHEHRMLARARVHRLQFAAPPGEQAQALLRIADLVAQIVRPAAERIDVVEILMQALGQQEADDVEILVVMRGQPARVGQRFFAAATPRCICLRDRPGNAVGPRNTERSGSL